MVLRVDSMPLGSHCVLRISKKEKERERERTRERGSECLREDGHNEREGKRERERERTDITRETEREKGCGVMGYLAHKKYPPSKTLEIPPF